MFLAYILLIGVLAAGQASAFPSLGKKRGITSELLNTFNLMEQYASAAYCTNNQNSPGDKIQCASGNCPLVQAANATSIIEFNERQLKTDVTGYIALDPTNHLIILSFRGSASFDNWMTNLDMTQTTTDLCPSCTAHRGFWNSWLDSRAQVLAALKQTSQANPGYAIAATGHSLGGAIASLAATQLRNAGYAVGLYTFGAPRIAGRALSAYTSAQAGGNYRVTHRNDPVPRLPPLAMGYVHLSPEYYIERRGGGVAEGDIRVYEGAVNVLVGNGAWVVTDVAAHMWYFNAISACYAKRASVGLRGVEGDVGVVMRF